MLRFFNWLLKFFKLKLVQPGKRVVPVDVEQAFLEVHELAQPRSMTSPERLYATYQAVRYAEMNQIEGDLVECGVWKGGNAMVMAKAMLSCNSTGREIYLYDTFEGMVEPGKKDIDFKGRHSEGEWKKQQTTGINKWCYAPIEEVQRNMALTGYPLERIRYIKGKVQDTLPGEIPARIAVLRLDTDWYESTLHELIHLYPRLSVGGILLIDDYGHWKGQKEAVDEFFAKMEYKPILFRTDYAGRAMIKPG
jgi:hypothetical protein